MSFFRRIWQHPGSGESAWYLGPYFITCSVLLVLVLVYPLVHSTAGILLLRLLFTAILLSALYTTTRSPIFFRVLLVLLVPVMLANWMIDPIAHPGASAVASLAILGAMLVATGVILKHIMTAKRINHDIIVGAVAVYLLAGVMWAAGYQIINDLAPGTVIDSVGAISSVTDRAAKFPVFIYFSFITLTSVGYGDLAPIGESARTLAVMEGVFGQLYTAILIARLVGMKIAQE